MSEPFDFDRDLGPGAEPPDAAPAERVEVPDVGKLLADVLNTLHAGDCSPGLYEARRGFGALVPGQTYPLKYVPQQSRIHLTLPAGWAPPETFVTAAEAVQSALADLSRQPLPAAVDFPARKALVSVVFALSRAADEARKRLNVSAEIVSERVLGDLSKRALAVARQAGAYADRQEAEAKAAVTATEAAQSALADEVLRFEQVGVRVRPYFRAGVAVRPYVRRRPRRPRP